MIGAIAAIDTAALVDNDYIDADGLDLSVGSRPILLTDEKLLLATPLSAYQTKTYALTTENTPASAFHIITGYGGFITTLDDVDLELGSNFEVEFSDAYINTDAGGTKNLLYKDGAFRLYISGAQEVTAEIPASNSIAYDTGNDSDVLQNTVDWLAQTFTTITATTVETIYLDLLQVNNSQTLTVGIRATAAGKPTGADIVSATAAEATGWIEFNIADTPLNAATQYALVLRGATDGVRWDCDATAPTYTGGTACTSGDSGATWATDATKDFQFRVYTSKTEATAINVASGEHDVKAWADGTDLYLSIDGAVAGDGYDVVALNSVVPSNANNWLIMDNSVTVFMPYMSYYKHTVSGTQIAYYQPNDIIVDVGATGTLPDRQANGGAENGTITWGTNPGTVSFTIASLTAPSISVYTAGEEPSRSVIGNVETSDWYVEPDVGGTLLTNPFRSFVVAVSDNTTLSEIEVWRLFGLIIVVAVTVMAWAAVPKHLIIASLAAGIAIVAMVVATIWPPYALTLLALCALGAWISERSPSL